MHYRRMAKIATLMLIAVVVSTGCVSSKMFRQNVDDTTQRIDSAESGIESNERRIADMREETDSKIAALEGQADAAMTIGRTAESKADDAQAAADKAALGRLL